MIVTKYFEALNLKRNPFSLSPDLEFYFLMASHAEAVDTVFFAFDHGSPMVRVYGEPGTGKTMLLRFLEKKFREERELEVKYFTFNPLLDVKGFFSKIFGGDETEDVERIVCEFFEKNKELVIFIDEAQEMCYDFFLLLKFISDKASLMGKRSFILFSGTPKLKEIFSRDEMKPLAQRAPYHCELVGLKKEEMAGYIEFRLKKSGYSGELPFKKRALGYMWKLTKGNPRKVNILAERSILAAMVRGKRLVGKKEVKEAYRDISEEIIKD